MSDRLNYPTDNELLSQLSSLTADLLWMSEADYPFEAFIWDDLTSITPEELCERTGHSPDTPVEVMELYRFFKRAVKEEDWHNEEEKAEVNRYQELVNFLKENLEDVKVYCLGKVEVDIYILGQSSGQLIGLKTKVVET